MLLTSQRAFIGKIKKYLNCFEQLVFALLPCSVTQIVSFSCCMLKVIYSNLKVKLASAFLVASVLAVTSSAPLYAQQANRVSSAERKQNEEIFVGRVRQGIFGSCNKTAPIKDARQRSIACTCYANAYIAKYSAQELYNLNQWQNNNPGKGQIIVMMLSPERKMCEIP